MTSIEEWNQVYKEERMKNLNTLEEESPYNVQGVNYDQFTYEWVDPSGYVFISKGSNK